MSSIAKTLREELEKIPLRPCINCGYMTRRKFCTPDCRIQDSDNRIEGVEEERDRYKKALEEIISAPISKQYDQLKDDCKTYDGLSFGNLQQIAKEAIKDE